MYFVILNYFVQDLDVECTILVLKWCGVLLNNAQVYLSSLLITKEFVEMMNALIQFGCSSTEHYAIDCVLDDLLIFLLNPNNWDSKVKNCAIFILTILEMGVLF